MDDSKKIEIINKAISICENQVSFENTKIKDYRHARGICFCVKNHEKYYDPLVGTIFRELKLGKNFSSEYVRKFIDILISDILKKGAEHIRIDPLSIDSFKDEFQDVIVYIPLDGLEIKTDKPLIIGKITLRNMNINEINELSDNFENLMEKILFINERARFEHIKFIKSVISSSFENKPITEFRIFAEEDIALEEARKECGQILDLLRFSSQFFHYRNTISIGFEGEIIRGNYPLIMHKANFYGYNIPKEYKGPLHNFEIDNYKIQHLEKIGILKLSKILEKSDSDKTGFENILLLALHWFSNFMTQKQIENQFLSLMITLEIFLTPGGERVSSYISDAAARILKLGLKDRKELKDEITKFYTKRSNIVHGKRDKMPDSDDVNQLQEIVARLFLWMIKKSQIFKDKDDLLKYIEKRKLA